MLNKSESLLMARKLCAIAGDNKMKIEVFENLIEKLRKNNFVEYYFDQKRQAYTAVVNGEIARDFI